MKKLILGLFALIASSNAYSDLSTGIESVTIDPTFSQITIKGNGLSSTGNTIVTLSGIRLATVSQTATTLVVECPDSPAFCSPGDWSMQVSTQTTDTLPVPVGQQTWDFTIGAVGPTGAIGPAGVNAPLPPTCLGVGNALQFDGTKWQCNTNTSPIFAVSLGYQSPGTFYPNNGGTVILGQPSINLGSGYTASTGTFTAPVAGYYFFSYLVTANIQPGNNVGDLNFAKNGVLLSEKISAVTTSGSTVSTWSDVTNTAIFYLNIGDTVSVMRACCNNEKPLGWRANFMGHYLHP